MYTIYRKYKHVDDLCMMNWIVGIIIICRRMVNLEKYLCMHVSKLAITIR